MNGNTFELLMRLIPLLMLALPILFVDSYKLIERTIKNGRNKN